jgi:peptidyl-prolyl cis-trans isomerase B (cyclophilin B)
MTTNTSTKKLLTAAVAGVLALLMALTIGLSGCGEKSNIADIQMQDGSIIKIQLYPDVAPKTVANFEKLVGEGFYNGLTFHRIVPGFVIQGGDPKGDGTGGSDQDIYGEFSANGWNNTLSQTRGVVAMARSSDYNSASSQFYICLSDSDASSLDGKYAAFGKVIEGMDEVDKIAAVQTDANDKPLDPVVMKTVTME